VSVKLRWDGPASVVELPVKKGQEWRWPRALALAFVLAYKDCCTCVDPPGDHSAADPLAHDLTCLYRKRNTA
jgi:hypothetical protein